MVIQLVHLVGAPDGAWVSPATVGPNAVGIVFGISVGTSTMVGATDMHTSTPSMQLAPTAEPSSIEQPGLRCVSVAGSARTTIKRKEHPLWLARTVDVANRVGTHAA